MVLPTSPNPDIALYYERPGDQIFATIKHHFPYIMDRSKELKDLLVKAILDDMILDHALASSLDEIGKVLEYQAQNEGIEKPKFSGEFILKDAERVGKLSFIMSLCRVLELPEEAAEAVRDAEIDRLWREGKPRKEPDRQALHLPGEVSGLLRDITKALSKKGTDGAGKDTSKPAGAARRSSKPDSKTSGRGTTKGS